MTSAHGRTAPGVCQAVGTCPGSQTRAAPRGLLLGVFCKLSIHLPRALPFVNGGEHPPDHHSSPLPSRALSPLRRASRARATPKHTVWMERSPLQCLAREKRKQKPRHDGNQSQVGAPGLPAEPCLLRPAPRGAAAPARPVPAVAAPREAARALPAACSSSPGEEQLPRVLRCLTAHSPP